MQTSDLGSGETSVLPSDPVILIACAIKFSSSKSVEFAKVEGSKVLKIGTSFSSDSRSSHKWRWRIGKRERDLGDR